MTTKELYEILENEMKMGRGNFRVIVWDTSHEEATDVLRDSAIQEFYILTGN